MAIRDHQHRHRHSHTHAVHHARTHTRTFSGLLVIRLREEAELNLAESSGEFLAGYRSDYCVRVRVRVC
jgi:hypothetical protein